MILQALNEYYHLLLEDSESGVAPPGYSPVDISFVIILSEVGELLDMIKVEIEMLVPEHKKRQGINPPPYFLCDKILYSLGVGKDKGEGKKRFEQYRKYNLELLQKAYCVEATAIKRFLTLWNPEVWKENQIIMRHSKEFEKPANYNTVYKIEGYSGFAHENAEITAIWMNEQQAGKDGEETTGQCLVTGQNGPIARTHEVAIKGAGGQSSGTALVSFQIESSCSYGKTQSYNAPVSKKVAFAYGTALNYLLASEINRVRLADTTMVFWADKKGGKAAETTLAWCLDPAVPEDDGEGEKRRISPGAAQQARTVLERVKAGMPAGDTDFNPEARCCLLGLAPNAARLSVRFWQVSKFGDVVAKIARHYKDMEIAGIDRIGGIVSPGRTLKELAVQGDSRNIPPLLGGQLLKAVVSGQLYPQTMYNAALNRCRTGGAHGGVNTIRAAVIKAFLLRQARIYNEADKEGLITVSLNETNTRPAYLLGRLFSLLEKVQREALGNSINATIRDRYFGAASATPGAVFPLLLRLSRHHIAKAQYGNAADWKIQQVMNGLDAFPAHLNMGEQGEFMLGYYHQNQANYLKKEKPEERQDIIND